MLATTHQRSNCLDAHIKKGMRLHGARRQRKQHKPKRKFSAACDAARVNTLVAEALATGAPDHDAAVSSILVEFLSAKIEQAEAVVRQLEREVGQLSQDAVRHIARLEARLQPVQVSMVPCTSEEPEPKTKLGSDHTSHNESRSV